MVSVRWLEAELRAAVHSNSSKNLSPYKNAYIKYSLSVQVYAIFSAVSPFYLAIRQPFSLALHFALLLSLCTAVH